MRDCFISIRNDSLRNNISTNSIYSTFSTALVQANQFFTERAFEFRGLAAEEYVIGIFWRKEPKIKQLSVDSSKNLIARLSQDQPTVDLRTIIINER